MNKLWLISSLSLVTVSLCFLLWARFQFSAPSTVAAPTTFIIYQGQSAKDILTSLASAKLIKSKLIAKIYLVYTRSDNRIRPGSYTLSPDQSLTEIFALLTSGPKSIWVTLPEGWRREQMAARLKNLLPDFDDQAYLSQTATLEGQLFPDTYLLPPDVSTSRVITLQLAALAQKTTLNLTNLYPLPTISGQISLSGREVLILASLVERESRSATDRPVIAGILLNRLKSNWPLQVDATVQYARDPVAGAYWSPITSTKFPSPFNTYLHPGLPPRPIANPGASAILAVLTPQTTSNWFYLHEPNGTPHYAPTIEAHQLNIDKYLKP